MTRSSRAWLPESALPRAEEPRLAPAPGAGALLVVWIKVGLQSFGGGNVAQLRAYELVVEEGRWLSPEGWSEARGLCQLVPGMNLIALPVLVGLRLAGLPGAAASAVGLLLPSVLITLLIATLYVHVQGSRLVASAVHGMIMAAAGAAILASWRLIEPIMARTRRMGPAALAATVAIVLASILLVLSGRVPIFGLLLISGFAMALVQHWVSRPSTP